MRIFQKSTHSSPPLQYFQPLHRILFFLILLAAPLSVSSADTYSVTSDSDVPVRRAQGTEYRTVALLKNGDPISSLEETEYWVKIRTASGKEGWVLKRYLSPTTSRDDSPTLPGKNSQDNKALNISTTLPDAPPHPLQPASSEPPVEKAQTAPLTKPAPQIDPTHAELEKELLELKNKLAAVTMENQELRDHEKIIWFLSGGAVFLVGWLLGLISGKARRRKPSLL
jgi:SH3 domain protein